MTASLFACPQCGIPLLTGSLDCHGCGSLVYRQRLTQLSREAMWLESVSTPAAARMWRQCLDLLPADSLEHAQISDRIGTLAAGFMQPSAMPLPYAPARDSSYESRWGTRHGRPATDPLFLALIKTIGSMLLSIVVYSLTGGWGFAIGFVLLMLVHEMGHVLAMRYYGLSASPPIFIPYLGALINLRQRPPNAKVEAIIGIGGPILGTVGALLCYALALALPLEPDSRGLMIEIACVGFFLNLFNLLPVPPMDGGRVMAAVSPWAWMLGIGGLIAFAVAIYLKTGHFSIVLPLILFFAFSRIRGTLGKSFRTDPYYRISRRSSWTIGISYLLLAGLLAVLFQITGGLRVIGL